MRRSRFSEEQIVGVLAEHEVSAATIGCGAHRARRPDARGVSVRFQGGRDQTAGVGRTLIVGGPHNVGRSRPVTGAASAYMHLF